MKVSKTTDRSKIEYFSELLRKFQEPVVSDLRNSWENFKNNCGNLKNFSVSMNERDLCF